MFSTLVVANWSFLNLKDISKIKYLLSTVSLASVYFVAAKFGFSLAFVHASVASIWLPTGIALAVFILFGYRFWPGIFMGALLANLTTEGNLFTSLAIACGNTFEGIMGAYLVNRFANGRYALETPSNIFRFMFFGGILASAISATIGVTNLSFFGFADWKNFEIIWFTWWLGDMSGALIFAPFLILWANNINFSILKNNILEKILAFGFLIAANLIVFKDLLFLEVQNYPVPFLITPFLVWIALRFEQREVAIAILLTAIIAFVSTLQGQGPFVLASQPHVALIFLSLFLLVVNIIAQIISVIVTEYKKSQEELRNRTNELIQVNEEIKKANTTKDEFLAMLAHELRNPLAPILSYLELLQLRGLNEPKIEEAVDGMKAQVKNMNRLLDDLLDISRITQGKVKLQKERIDIKALIDKVQKDTAAFMESRHHTFYVDLPAEPVWLMADPLRLEQILVNIVNNAAKYTEPGGEIYITCVHDDDNIVIRIKDTGMGISKDMTTKIFDMFSQGPHPLGGPQGGLGVGLKLAKTLTEFHGGTITAHSEGLGMGSEFIISLPARRKIDSLPIITKKAELDNVKKMALEEKIEKHKRKILVIDDNEAAANSLAKLLGHMGHEVVVAYEGLEGIKKTDSYHPEIILLDVGLPGLSGYEVAEKLRNEYKYSGALVAITGYGQEEDKRLSMKAGFDYHLVKPVGIVDLEELFSKL